MLNELSTSLPFGITYATNVGEAVLGDADGDRVDIVIRHGVVSHGWQTKEIPDSCRRLLAISLSVPVAARHSTGALALLLLFSAAYPS